MALMLIVAFCMASQAAEPSASDDRGPQVAACADGDHRERVAQVTLMASAGQGVAFEQMWFRSPRNPEWKRFELVPFGQGGGTTGARLELPMVATGGDWPGLQCRWDLRADLVGGRSVIRRKVDVCRMDGWHFTAGGDRLARAKGIKD